MLAFWHDQASATRTHYTQTRLSRQFGLVSEPFLCCRDYAGKRAGGAGRTIKADPAQYPSREGTMRLCCMRLVLICYQSLAGQNRRRSMAWPGSSCTHYQMWCSRTPFLDVVCAWFALGLTRGFAGGVGTPGCRSGKLLCIFAYTLFSLIHVVQLNACCAALRILYSLTPIVQATTSGAAMTCCFCNNVEGNAVLEN